MTLADRISRLRGLLAERLSRNATCTAVRCVHHRQAHQALLEVVEWAESLSPVWAGRDILFERLERALDGEKEVE